MPSCVTKNQVLTAYGIAPESGSVAIPCVLNMASEIADLRNELNRVRSCKVLSDLELLKLAQELVDGSKQLDGILALTLLEVAQRIIDVTKV